MVQMYKELSPNDHFVISIPQQISMHERQLITLFYQPLTGAQPISLYLTLWAEGEMNETESISHYYLMNVLGVSIKAIFEARIALEAIGLLRTWKTVEGDERSFIYEIVRPLEAETFFADPLLSMFLYSKIGERAYRKLRTRFTSSINYDRFEDVSRSFTDVYKPVHVRMDVEPIQAQQVKQGYTFTPEPFDFDLLLAGLNEQLVPTKALTSEVREEIAKLAFMYQLSPFEMQNVVMMAFDANMQFSYDRLRKYSSDYYKANISTDTPSLKPVYEQPAKPVIQTLSKEEQMIQYYETTSPVEHLMMKNGGNPPSDYTRKIVEDLMLYQKMNPGVINVLIDYVLSISDGKLPKNFVESMADYWQRSHIKTVKEAMEIARQEYDKRNGKPVVEMEVTYESPLRVYLKHLYNGKEPVSFIVDIAEDLVQKHGLPVPVVNVLMEYVLQQKNGRMNRKYIETIASNWQLKNVVTSEQALQQLAQFKEEIEAKKAPTANVRITASNVEQYMSESEIDADYAYYETTPPYEFLKNYNNGQEPFYMTVKIAEDLVLTYGLPVGVVNVLAEYVLTIQNGQFPKRYVETIASSWRQMQILTARQALDHVVEQAEETSLKRKLGYVPKITKQSLHIRTDLAQQYEGYNRLTPYEFLKHLSNNKEPLASNVRIAENLVLQFDLPVEVTNVLVEHVFKLQNGNLPKNFTESIAKNWQISGVKTVEQAFEQLESASTQRNYKETLGYIPTISREQVLEQAKTLQTVVEPYDLMAPYAFLKEHMLNGIEPLANSVKMVEEAVTRFELPVGVINVLIEYVMEIQNMRLPKPYFFAICQDWKLRNIVSTEQALENVKQSHEKFQNQQHTANNKQLMDKPDWFDKRNETTAAVETSEQFEQQKKKLLEQLSKLDGE